MLDLNTATGRAEYCRRLTLARKAKYKTQDAFAEVMGVKRETVTKWETGANLPPLDTLAQICSKLDIDFGYLMSSYNEENELLHLICSETGLSQDAVKRLRKEEGNVRLQKFNKLVVNEKLWEILNNFANLSGFTKERQKENEKRSKQYWDIIRAGEDPDDNELYQRVAKALDRARYNYELDRYQCQILFKSIVDEFLPK